MIEVLVVRRRRLHVARIHTGFVERTSGFTLTGTAHTGAEALEAAARLQPDLVLLDVYLPDVSGLDLLGDLREAAPEVDVLVISAAREADTVRRALRGWIVHYLMKPFSYDDLRLRLEHYQQTYAGMAGEHTDRAEIDRVFNITSASEKPSLPKGFRAETSRWSRTPCAVGTPPTATSRRPRRPNCSESHGSAHVATSSTSVTAGGSRSPCATARSGAPSGATRGAEHPTRAHDERYTTLDWDSCHGR